MGGQFEPDPASLLWDTAAANVLGRAYAARGQWVAVRIADPTIRQRAALLALGISPLGPDAPSALGGRRGGLNARDRWRRAFVRALYRANDARRGGPGRPVEVEVGRKLPVRGVIPAGRPVRVRIRRGNATAAVQRKSNADRIWLDEGGTGLRFSDPELRDW